MRAINNIYIALTSIVLLGACNNKKEVIDEGKAYIRFINLTSENTRFYVDNTINLNGDTAVYNFQGELFQNITTDYVPVSQAISPLLSSIVKTTVTEIISVENLEFQNPKFSAGTYIDLNDQFDIGLYKFAVQQQSYFPNSTHRIPTGKIINGVTYYKWAEINAGTKNFSFNPSEPAVIGGIKTVRILPESYKETKVLEKGAYYTYLLADVSFSSTENATPKLITIKENVEDYNFKDSSSYVRFINFSPTNPSNEQYNVRTESIDVYFVKKEGDSVYSEVPVGLNLKRFAVNELQGGFFEIDMRPILREFASTDSVSNISALSKFKYTFRIYRSGDSEALQRSHFSELSVSLGINNLALATTRESNLLLLSLDPSGYRTVIHTILLQPRVARGGEIVGTRFIAYSYQRENAIDGYYQD